MPCPLRANSLVLIALLLALPAPHGARGAEIDRLEVAEHDHGYDIQLDAVLNAPSSRVFAILADFVHLDRINPDIISSSVNAAPDGVGQRVHTLLHSCVWLFCRKLLQVEDVTTTNDSLISAQIVPGAGDFASGSSTWQVTADGAGTHIHYQATRRPGFWVPPGVGGLGLRNALQKQFKHSMAALEALASQ